MGLYEKIEEIRKKPEHIRTRYVWGAVIVSMIFILTVWFFYFWGKATQEKIKSEKIEIFDNIESPKKSLDEYKSQFNDLKNQMESENLENIDDGETEIITPSELLPNQEF